MLVHNYEKLIVWQKAMDLVEKTYRLTYAFPKEEQYGIISQMRRSAVSIPSNIAEGSRRGTKKDFTHFLVIAFGSAGEIETQLKIAKRLQFGKIDNYKEIEEILQEILRMLNKLIESKSV